MNAIAKPFGMLLMFLYDLVKNYGWAIILFAIIVKGILLPFQMKSKRGTMRTARIQPKLAELQKKHSANKTKLNEETAKLYKEEGINPASGCLWGLLPFPIMIALFMAIRQPITLMMGIDEVVLTEPGAIYDTLQEMPESTISTYYEQIDQAKWLSESPDFDKFLEIEPKLKKIDFSFYGINLGKQPQWNFLWSDHSEDTDSWASGFILFLIPLINGATQFAASIISRKTNPTSSPEGQGGSMQIMMMLMPLISVYFAFITPSALGLYWTMGTVLQIGQDLWLTKRYTRILDAEDIVKNEAREKKEAELEAKRIESERRKAEGLVARNPNTSKRKKQKTNKQEQIEKAVEWQKKDEPPAETSPSRVGERKYARGRAYDPDRYKDAGKSDGDADDDDDDDEIRALPGGDDDEALDADDEGYEGDDDDGGDEYDEDDDDDDDEDDDDEYDDDDDEYDEDDDDDDDEYEDDDDDDDDEYDDDDDE